MSYTAKVYKPDPDELHLASGGKIEFDKTSNPVAITNTSGNLIFTNLPTSDPTVAGALWSNAGVLTISAG